MREMFILSFDFDRIAYDRWINIERYPDLTGEIDSLLQEVLPLVKPRLLLREAAIEGTDKSQVTVGGFVFSSAVLSWNLAQTDRVWAYLVSCGPEIYGRMKGEEEPLRQYWLDALAEMAVQFASEQAEKLLRERLGEEITLSYMNPGSADRDVWELKDQGPLFKLLENPGEIGVSLTEGWLMEPSKSLSGFFFFSPQGFLPCWVCSQKMCPTRRASFRADFKESLRKG